MVTLDAESMITCRFIKLVSMICLLDWLRWQHYLYAYCICTLCILYKLFTIALYGFKNCIASKDVPIIYGKFISSFAVVWLQSGQATMAIVMCNCNHFGTILY